MFMAHESNVFDATGAPVAPTATFQHVLRAEMAGQGDALRRLLHNRLMPATGDVLFDDLRLSEHAMRDLDRIVLVGGGSSLHAAKAGKYLIEILAGIPVQVEHAAEFRHHAPVMSRSALCIGVSQSGETDDTVEALRIAALRGAPTLALVNGVGSTLAREARGRLYLHAGPQQGAVSTQGYTCQVVALALLGLAFGRARGLVPSQARAFAAALQGLPPLVEQALAAAEEVEQVAQQLVSARSMLFAGRHVHYPVALEGAHLLTVLSGIHADGYTAAELEHGPIALVDALMPVVVLAPHDTLFEQQQHTMRTVKARRGLVVAVTTRDEPALLKGLADYTLRVPPTHPLLQGVLSVIPLQLLAYHVAVLRGANVDRPRKLARSATVE